MIKSTISNDKIRKYSLFYLLSSDTVVKVQTYTTH